MWLHRTHLADPRLHLGGALIVVAIWIALVFGAASSAQCPDCPGHVESIRDCLCSHAPALIGTDRR